MISLSITPTLASKALQTPGGFLWWYLDIVDKKGNGLVLIWSFGLPFLPNYASKARRNNPQPPKERPSIVISIYKNFKLDCYLFQEFSPEEVEWNESEWRFGTNHFSASTNTLSVSLDLPIPKTKLTMTGTINVRGTRRSSGSRTSETVHEWVPILMPAESKVDISCGETRYRFSGRAYHDHNSALLPLHELKIQSWWWGRIAFPEHELIWYSLRSNQDQPPINLTISVSKDGRVDINENGICECKNLHKSIFGLSSPASFLLQTPTGDTVTVTTKSTVDDGPFYQRYIVSAVSNGEDLFGFAEQVVPDLVDGDWMRPLVQMRVAHSEREKNSFWLPLFTGPKTGRWKRLFQQFYTKDLA